MMASGNYRIVYCGQQSHQIAQHLQSIWLTIQEALESIDSAGPAGTPLYNTFFRGVDPTTVKGVLSSVAIGASIPSNDGARNPTIVCDNPSVPEVLSSDAHAECQNVRGLVALWVKQSNTVFLCPKYLLTTRLEPAPHIVSATSRAGVTARGLCWGRRSGRCCSTSWCISTSVSRVWRRRPVGSSPLWICRRRCRLLIRRAMSSSWLVCWLHIYVCDLLGECGLM